jgi:carboxymethylenebutenolidase
MSEQREIDPRVVTLYDEYCHGRIDRREFLARASALFIGGVSALAMAQAMFPRYAEAQTISFTDERIRANYVDYDSPGGTSGRMRGYLVRPTAEPPFPAVLVIHENRGLNPHIEDVARRAAAEGFLALAPDGLAPVGGYPGNDDDGRQLQSSLDREKLARDMINSARWLNGHELSTGKLGVPFYGSAPATVDVPKIKSPLLIQLAENDERINANWPAAEAALTAAGVPFTKHIYPGTNHGFHNNSTPRFDEAAAALAWERTIAFFREQLA